jgi:hypothetical protein
LSDSRVKSAALSVSTLLPRARRPYVAQIIKQ